MIALSSCNHCNAAECFLVKLSWYRNEQALQKNILFYCFRRICHALTIASITVTLSSSGG